MIQPLVQTWPNTRDAFYELIDGQTFADQTVTGYYRLQADFADRLPAVLIFQSGGTITTSTNRQDRLRVDVYAPGTQADQVAQAICALLTSRWHMTGYGRIDRIVAEATPNDVHYADPSIAISSAVYRASVRPI